VVVPRGDLKLGDSELPTYVRMKDPFDHGTSSSCPWVSDDPLDGEHSRATEKCGAPQQRCGADPRCSGWTYSVCEFEMLAGL
jgi:hypothetical protein